MKIFRLRIPKKKNVFFVFLFLLSISLLAQEKKMIKNEMSLVKSIDDTDIVWNPAPDFFPGCSFTILHGEIENPNLDFFFKIEPNTNVISHTHNSSERMILITGELEVNYEGEKSKILKAGNYAYGPAKKPHKAKCLDKGPCVLFIAMVEPFDAVPIE
ncbi:cupin domain-containing protein [Thalassobellus suaedae]|uniref:Cupin domain-containing protein n=1 Tax=Thalassobellus suaedae TaxID=3074124 RepID=A0ABY9Y5D1_9FLAO|nr:cupin domain-containing protein [Flavobacteriaceae bacterium HL-DH10]